MNRREMMKAAAAALLCPPTTAALPGQVAKPGWDRWRMAWQIIHDLPRADVDYALVTMRKMAKESYR